jgi:transposase-like protein
VTREGRKIPLGFIETGAENERVCREMLEGLLERGLKIESGLLCVVDGSKGLRKAIYGVFGNKALIQRCQWHSVPRRAQTRRMRCSSPDNTSKSGSLGQMVAAQAAIMKHARQCVASTHAGPANKPIGCSYQANVT